ncbi:MAG: prepilin-type N-terminal cleavage/methylation domain-containing protein [Pseudomonadota bacterium]
MTGSQRADLAPQSGFTLVELIGIIAIAGILLAVAAPRFFSASTFEARGYEDGARAFIRYAQKVAIARHGTVYVHVTGTGLTLCASQATPCSSGLPGPDGDSPFQLILPSQVTQSPTSAVLAFDAQGRPDAGLAITLTGTQARVLTVEAETGYVH